MSEIPSKIAEILMRTAGRPVHERVFVGSVLGRKRPITADDFTQKEQARLAEDIVAARARRTMHGVPAAQQAYFNSGGGTIQPEDYLAAEVKRSGNDPNKWTDVYDDPIYNTIGTSRYAPNPDGSKQVTDNYDWKNYYDDNQRNRAGYENMALKDKIAKVLEAGKYRGGLFSQSTAEQAALAFAPNVSIPINVRVPKKLSNTGK